LVRYNLTRRWNSNEKCRKVSAIVICLQTRMLSDLIPSINFPESTRF